MPAHLGRLLSGCSQRSQRLRELLQDSLDPDIASGDLVLIDVVKRPRLLQNEQVLGPVMAGQGLRDHFCARMATGVAHCRQHGRVALTGDDRPDNAHAGSPGDISPSTSWSGTVCPLITRSTK